MGYYERIKNFLIEQEGKGFLLTREKELKGWATRKSHMSPTTLHEKLDDLVRWGHLIRVEKIVKGHLGVFYGINDRFREWWLSQIRDQEQKGREVNKLNKAEKMEALKELIGFTMYRFADFVPFYICHLLQNATKISDLTESLDTFWNWCLYPSIFVTAQACLRDKEIVSEFEIIKRMEKSFQEYIRSDFYKNLRESGIIT